MRTMMVSILVFVLVGCAGMQSIAVKPGMTRDEVKAAGQQDKLECEYEAELNTGSNPEAYKTNPFMSQSANMGAAAGEGFAQGMMEGMRKINLVKKCMQIRGYLIIPRSSVSESYLNGNTPY